MAYCPFEELNDGSCHACKALGPNFEYVFDSVALS